MFNPTRKDIRRIQYLARETEIDLAYVNNCPKPNFISQRLPLRAAQAAALAREVAERSQ